MEPTEQVSPWKASWDHRPGGGYVGVAVARVTDAEGARLRSVSCSHKHVINMTAFSCAARMVRSLNRSGVVS